MPPLKPVNPCSWSRGPLFSSSQLETFFNRIELPKNRRIRSVDVLRPDESLALLTAIYQRMLVSIPFENLNLHYRKDRNVDLDPNALLRKVTKSGNRRGGYCLENNSLLKIVLRSMGFKVFSVAARVYEGNDSWTPWRHCINIVTIKEDQYTLDAGFGSRAAIQPLPLVHGTVQQHIASAQNRILYTHLEDFSNPSHRAWRLDYRRSREHEWQQCYAWVETEIFARDLEATALNVKMDPKTWVTQRAVASRFSAAEGSSKINGTVTLAGDRLDIEHEGRMVVNKVLKSENERIHHLKTLFGIVLCDEEQNAIQGRASELPSNPRSRC